MRPLVLRPQIKKVANKSQKVAEPEAIIKTFNACEKAGVLDEGVLASSLLSPKGRRPRSDGRSRMKSHTRVPARSKPPTEGRTAMRHPPFSTSEAASGRKTS